MGRLYSLESKFWRGTIVDKIRTAVMKCPGCGFCGYLMGHRIEESGEVYPAVECPECEFCELVVLNGWPWRGKLDEGPEVFYRGSWEGME